MTQAQINIVMKVSKNEFKIYEELGLRQEGSLISISHSQAKLISTSIFWCSAIISFISLSKYSDIKEIGDNEVLISVAVMIIALISYFMDETMKNMDPHN